MDEMGFDLYHNAVSYREDLFAEHRIHKNISGGVEIKYSTTNQWNFKLSNQHIDDLRKKLQKIKDIPKDKKSKTSFLVDYAMNNESMRVILNQMVTQLMKKQSAFVYILQQHKECINPDEIDLFRYNGLFMSQFLVLKTLCNNLVVNHNIGGSTTPCNTCFKDRKLMQLSYYSNMFEKESKKYKKGTDPIFFLDASDWESVLDIPSKNQCICYIVKKKKKVCNYE